MAWPEGSTLVSVRRGTEVLVPSGTTILRADDVITAFGTPGSQRRVIERLDASSDDVTAEITATIPIVTPAESETGDDAPGGA